MVRGAQPGIGRAKSFACGGGLALGRAEPVAVRRVGRVDLGERRARGRLVGRAGGDLRAQRVALLRERPFALAECRDVAVGAGHPLLGDMRRCLGPARAGSRRRGARSSRPADFAGQAVAARPQLGGARLPGRQRRPVGRVIAGLAGGRPTVRRVMPVVGPERRERQPALARARRSRRSACASCQDASRTTVSSRRAASRSASSAARRAPAARLSPARAASIASAAARASAARPTAVARRSATSASSASASALQLGCLGAPLEHRVTRAERRRPGP